MSKLVNNNIVVKYVRRSNVINNFTVTHVHLEDQNPLKSIVKEMMIIIIIVNMMIMKETEIEKEIDIADLMMMVIIDADVDLYLVKEKEKEIEIEREIVEHLEDVSEHIYFFINSY